MTTILIILVLAAIVAGVVFWVRRKGEPVRPYEGHQDQDTAWNDPVSGAAPPPAAKPDPERPLR